MSISSKGSWDFPGVENIRKYPRPLKVYCDDNQIDSLRKQIKEAFVEINNLKQTHKF